MKKYKTYAEVPKRTQNAISARIKAAIEKYGFDAVRLVTRRYIDQILNRLKLQKEIEEKEVALIELQNQLK